MKKLADIDYTGTLAKVMEAVMDGGTTLPSITSTVTPRLLDGDVARMGGPEAIVAWAVDELKKKGAVENGAGRLKIVQPYFKHRGRQVDILPRTAREALSRKGFLELRLAQEWQKARKAGNLPHRTKPNPSVKRSIAEHGYRRYLGDIIEDEHGDVVVGRNRKQALLDLGIDPAPYTTPKRYGDGMAADADRLRDAILDNAGDSLSNATVAQIARNVLAESGDYTLDNVLEVLIGSATSKELQKEVVLDLYEHTEMSNRAIGRAVGVSDVQVGRWVQQNVAPEQKESERPQKKVAFAKRPEIRAEYRRLRTSGMTNEMICEVMGIGEGTRASIDNAVAAEARPSGSCRICGHEPHDCET